MTDGKEFVPRTFRMSQLVKSVALSTVLGAACFLPIAANAQTMSTVTTTRTWTATPMNDSSYDADNAAGIDYKILANPSFNYAQIMRAKDLGMSDDEIGQVFGLAKAADVPVREVVDRVENGWTFPTIADYYGAFPGWQNPKYGAEVHEYMVAYRHSGRGALRHDGYSDSTTIWNNNNTGMRNSDDMSNPPMPASVTPGSPMIPAPSPMTGPATPGVAGQ
jgi:hypothetical protein